MVYIPFNQTCHTILEKKIPTNTDFLRKNPFFTRPNCLKTKVIQGKNTYCIAILQKDPSEKKHFSQVLTAGCQQDFRISPNGTL